jgi:hypothetical protein
MLGDQQTAYCNIPMISFALVAVAPISLAVLFSAKMKFWFDTRPVMLAIGFLIPCVIAAGLAIHAEL